MQAQPVHRPSESAIPGPSRPVEPLPQQPQSQPQPQPHPQASTSRATSAKSSSPAGTVIAVNAPPIRVPRLSAELAHRRREAIQNDDHATLQSKQKRQSLPVLGPKSIFTPSIITPPPPVKRTPGITRKRKPPDGGHDGQSGKKRASSISSTTAVYEYNQRVESGQKVVPPISALHIESTHKPEGTALPPTAQSSTPVPNPNTEATEGAQATPTMKEPHTEQTADIQRKKSAKKRMQAIDLTTDSDYEEEEIVEMPLTPRQAVRHSTLWTDVSLRSLAGADGFVAIDKT